MTRLAFTMALLLGAVAPAMAQSGIAIGAPTVAGTGCPAGTVAVTMAPDNLSMRVRFDRMMASAGGSTGRASETKTCNIAVPFRVLPNFNVSVRLVGYNGYNALAAGARATYHVDTFWAGRRGPAFDRTFNGPVTAAFLDARGIAAAGIVWMRCGTEGQLRLNTSIAVTTTQNRAAEASFVGVSPAALVFTLQYRRC